MHTLHDYVNFLAGHTVSSAFNYPYLLPFNDLIAFLLAIGEYGSLTVTSRAIDRFTVHAYTYEPLVRG